MSNAANSEPWSIARLLNWTREYFERGGLESPRLCAEILLAHALGCRRLELYTRFETIPGDEPLARFRSAVKEAAAGKPIAYLTGTREFFSLPFAVTPAVLIPRPETEVLVERAIALVRGGNESLRILDIGTGSGCIAISLAKHLSSAKIYASDVSDEALAIAKQNAATNGVAERVEFRAGDLLEPWRDAEPFDLIVSNPPYIGTDEAAMLPANVRDHEPHAALFAGADGLAIHRRLVRESPAILDCDGRVLIEMSYNQSAAVRALFTDAGWREIETFRDDLRHERVLHARRPAD